MQLSDWFPVILFSSLYCCVICCCFVYDCYARKHQKNNGIMRVRIFRRRTVVPVGEPTKPQQAVLADEVNVVVDE